MRRPLIAGNWKMYQTIAQTEKYFTEFAPLVRDVVDRDIVLGVPFPALATAVKAANGTAIGIAAQNCHWEKEGAYTGEISVPMIEATGAAYVIIGHSERRQYFGETDADVNRKLKAVLNGGLIPIMCVGETLQDREDEKTFAVIEGQLSRGLEGLSQKEAREVIIAYEPVWAIGTGRTATPDQAQEVHIYIRGQLNNLFNEDIANGEKILYGGSVKPGNIDDLMSKPDIDGALVGGASLKADEFARIVKF